MDRDADSAAQANLKRITVPVYSTDPGRHLDYLDELRSHLHLLPESIAGLPGLGAGLQGRAVRGEVAERRRGGA